MNPLYIKCIFDLYYIYYKNIVILLFIFVLDLYVCAQLSLIYTFLVFFLTNNKICWPQTI